MYGHNTYTTYKYIYTHMYAYNTYTTSTYIHTQYTYAHTRNIHTAESISFYLTIYVSDQYFILGTKIQLPGKL